MDESPGGVGELMIKTLERKGEGREVRGDPSFKMGKCMPTFWPREESNRKKKRWKYEWEERMHIEGTGEINLDQGTELWLRVLRGKGWVGKLKACLYNRALQKCHLKSSTALQVKKQELWRVPMWCLWDSFLAEIQCCSQDTGTRLAPTIHTRCFKIDSLKGDLRNFHFFCFWKNIQHKNHSINNFEVQSQWHLVYSQCFTTTSTV